MDMFPDSKTIFVKQVSIGELQLNKGGFECHCESIDINQRANDSVIDFFIKGINGDITMLKSGLTYQFVIDTSNNTMLHIKDVYINNIVSAPHGEFIGIFGIAQTMWEEHLELNLDIRV